MSKLDNPEPEPDEEDIFTEDHHHFYHNGKLVVEVPEGEDWQPYLREYTEKEGFFPNIWFTSDHGNNHLISVTDDGNYITDD